jgi:hypothetical protein
MKEALLKMKKKQQKKLEKALAGKSAIGQSFINNIKAKLGIQSGVKAAAKDLGVRIKGSAASAPKPAPKPVSPSPPKSPSGLTPAEFDFKSALNLVNAQGNIDSQIARLNSEASRNVASIQSGASVDAARLAKEADLYRADRGLEASLGVENIRSRGAIDLQKIMNEGNERVEKIRGTFGLKTRGIERGSAILSALSSAFNF